MKINLTGFRFYTIAFLLTATFASCSNFLDVAPKEFYQESDLLDDIVELEKELTALYNGLPLDYWTAYGDASNAVMSASSDEAAGNWTDMASFLYEDGTWNQSNNPLGRWNAYQLIRTAHHFIEHIDNVPVKDKQREAYYNARRTHFKMEAKFFIAFYTFELFKRYGAVPVIDHYITAKEVTEKLPTPRNSTDEAVNFMVGILDEVIPNLDPSYLETRDAGRITRGAAQALKAKILVYAASPLFNGGEIDGNPVSVEGQLLKSTLLSVRNTDGKVLFNTSYDREKWKRAADAANEIIQSGAYSLYPKQAELFMSRNYTEVIFHRQMGFSTTFEYGTGPNGTDYGMWGALSPTQEQVDSYEMSNGRFITDPLSGYKKTGTKDTTMNVFRNRNWTTVRVPIHNMYINRDPRFYTDVYFNGMPLLHRNVLTEFSGNTGQSNDGWGGKTGNSTRTGYYVQKWNDPSQTVLSNPKSIARNFPYYRYAEVLLWYAEAMNEYLDAPNGQVYDAINQVRRRVGMPALPITSEDQTKEGMRKRIQNERRVELAYEGARFWDIRRWLIAHTPAITSFTGLNYTSPSPGFYNVREIRQGGKRVFRLNHYLMPIPADEIVKSNGAIVQNYGW
ncbi:RagB/SusD family nutrient uptake outer membrane protein [Arcticibacter sp.]|uniref:RagB/SusD family nutrient uptake outer membrane protein n=1 Tax=Arcticibacter sp. TaxID=1872630 RepID=UPI00388FC247